MKRGARVRLDIAPEHRHGRGKRLHNRLGTVLNVVPAGWNDAYAVTVQIDHGGKVAVRKSEITEG